MMNETQRLTYLAHLGIDVYILRKPLEGATPSAVMDSSMTGQQESAARVKSPVECLEPQEKLDIASSPASSNLTSAEVEINSKSTSANTPGAQLKIQADNIRFTLHCWRISDSLLVLDEHEPGAALPTDTLLLNIVRSVGHRMTQLPRSELLRWPLFSQDQNANDERQARAMVQAYIQAQASKKTARYLLLMGSAAAKFTLDEFDDWQLIQGKSFQQWQMTLIATPSLASMLREPLLKRVTWQAVKSMCRNINRP